MEAGRGRKTYPIEVGKERRGAGIDGKRVKRPDPQGTIETQRIKPVRLL